MLALDREERPAYVRFERRPVENKSASLKAGHAVCVDIDFALVTPPYSKDCVEYKVETWLRNMNQNLVNKRIPPEWAKHWKAQYEAWKEGNETPVDGTDVRNWSAITPAQVKNLIAAGCRTIEDLAAANDQALRHIGMGANELKRKATSYIQATKDHGPLVMENDALAAENEQLKGTIDSLQGQLKKLAFDVQALQGHRMDVDAEESNDVISIDDVLDNDIQAARELYQERFGDAPHHRMKYDTIMEKLNA